MHPKPQIFRHIQTKTSKFAFENEIILRAHNCFINSIQNSTHKINSKVKRLNKTPQSLCEIYIRSSFSIQDVITDEDYYPRRNVWKNILLRPLYFLKQL